MTPTNPTAARGHAARFATLLMTLTLLVLGGCAEDTILPVDSECGNGVREGEEGHLVGGVEAGVRLGDCNIWCVVVQS